MSRFLEECPKCKTKVKQNESEEITKCPECNTCLGITQIMSRVTGFFTDTRNWNKGKKSEFKDRQEYTPLKML